MVDLGLTQNAMGGVAVFLASLVECIEALTIVLAVGTVRGWLWSLLGAACGGVLLVASVVLAGGAFLHLPLNVLHILIGAILLPFGFSWLRKAVRRTARLKALREEALIYDQQIVRLRSERPVLPHHRFDLIALAVAFKAVVIEGAEIVVLVVAVGRGAGALFPAAVGATAAAMVVIALGVVIHRPLTRVPENALKFAIGVVIISFGIFWLGEGAGLLWPGGDLALIAIMTGVFAISYLWAAMLCNRSTGRVCPHLYLMSNGLAVSRRVRPRRTREAATLRSCWSGSDN